VTNSLGAIARQVAPSSASFDVAGPPRGAGGDVTSPTDTGT
jgi:hypothetical protein